MTIAVLQLELDIFGADSLKEKRMVVNSLLDKIRARFNVSAAQLDEHDLWNRATIGVAVISNSAQAAQRVLHHVRDVVEAENRCDVVDCRIESL